MNYNTLRNKPTINYRELIGDSAISEVGGITEEEFNDLLDTDLTSYYTKAQIDELFARSFVYREKSGSIVTFDCPASITTGISVVTSEIVAVQAGTGDPSPTNVRPFSGWSAVNVTMCGKNLLDADNIEGLYPNISAVRYGQKFTKAGTYYLKKTNEYGTYISAKVKYAGGTWSPNYYISNNVGGSPATITLADGDELYIFDDLHNQATSIQEFKKAGIMVTLGAYADEFIAYNGTTYTTQLKDGQGNPLTCYGGQLVNENGVQRLELTHGHIASYNGETLPSTWISDRDVYAEGTTPTTGAEVVYELATPQTIPQDNLPIASQSGTNNMWADSGDITVTALDKIIQG